MALPVDQMSNQDEANIRPGDVIEGPSDSYEVLARLGGGGEADVYRVRSGRFSMVFAAKVIRRIVDHTSEAISECAAMAKLDHPSVISCYGILVHQGRTVLIYEYCEGGTLADLLRLHPHGLPTGQFRDLARQLIDGIAYCHDHGIAHCDLKPGNVLFRDAERSVLKITDFGLCTHGPGGHAMRGTLRYLAPEHFSSMKVEAKPADVWSLAIMLIEMKMGSVPFHSGIASEVPRLPQDGNFLWHDVDQRLSALWKWMLSMEPAKRPTLAEVATHPALDATNRPSSSGVPRSTSLPRGISALQMGRRRSPFGLSGGQGRLPLMNSRGSSGDQGFRPLKRGQAMATSSMSNRIMPEPVGLPPVE
jgi:serine/threonine protein kinase